ncbi:phosphate acyltransferase PlsX [Nicoliella spurrieriana]|uniref:Phosphate acyltransferase n=1 Tax=Nicoliella spurrieriana TaxID=2925830 RepID=A0A976RRX1_9LACO|nr:phosphate acyltransferase PlsX [Nicoliella spurrieriana]UQS86635.1 phosphate acyltransferase PlsX [Nicoliella spurrieriana]
MKIAVDAMGGDYAPTEVVKGVEMARDRYSDMHFQLYGPKDQVEPLIANNERITVIHTEQVIEMGEEPVRAVKKKKDSSMVKAAEAVKNGDADAFLSGGNTGALLTAGLFIVGRIKGIERPALTTTLPMVEGPNSKFVMLDVGANADSRPFHLYQYAFMGNYYAKAVLGIKNPRVGLLNNGTEADKGDKLHRAVHDLLAANHDLNFIGNVESRELLNGAADVVVTDGFTGNAALKSTEGTALTMLNLIKSSIMNGGLTDKLGAYLLKNTFKEINTKLDYSKYGGAVLIGVKAPVVKMHGSSKATTVRNTLGQIHTMVESNTVGQIVDYFNAHADAMKAIKQEAKNN